MYFFYLIIVDSQDLHVLTHSFPTRRASELQVVRERNVGNYDANPKFLGLPRNEQMIAANIYRVEMSQRLFNNDCSVMPVTIYPVDHQADRKSTRLNSSH